MIIDPSAIVQAVASSSVSPIPTVIPGNEPIYQVAGDIGNRTLWLVACNLLYLDLQSDFIRIVCVIMGLSSLAFYAMAFRVPVVSESFRALPTKSKLTAW